MSCSSGIIVLVQGKRRGGGLEKNCLDTYVDVGGLYGKEVALYILLVHSSIGGTKKLIERHNNSNQLITLVPNTT